MYACMRVGYARFAGYACMCACYCFYGMYVGGVVFVWMCVVCVCMLGMYVMYAHMVRMSVSYVCMLSVYVMCVGCVVL